MSGGYLTLDLREIKDTSGVLIKKGIYNYILNTYKPIEVLVSQELIDNFMGNEKGVLCKTFRINLTELLENSEYGVTQQGINLPVGYHENYDETKKIRSIGLALFRLVITKNDEISFQEI